VWAAVLLHTSVRNGQRKQLQAVHSGHAQWLEGDITLKHVTFMLPTQSCCCTELLLNRKASTYIITHDAVTCLTGLLSCFQSHCRIM